MMIPIFEGVINIPQRHINRTIHVKFCCHEVLSCWENILLDVNLSKDMNPTILVRDPTPKVLAISPIQGSTVNVEPPAVMCLIKVPHW
jgi:hypothetical protein